MTCVTHDSNARFPFKRPIDCSDLLRLNDANQITYSGPGADMTVYSISRVHGLSRSADRMGE